MDRIINWGLESKIVDGSPWLILAQMVADIHEPRAYTRNYNGSESEDTNANEVGNYSGVGHGGLKALQEIARNNNEKKSDSDKIRSRRWDLTEGIGAGTQLERSLNEGITVRRCFALDD